MIALQFKHVLMISFCSDGIDCTSAAIIIRVRNVIFTGDILTCIV